MDQSNRTSGVRGVIADVMYEYFRFHKLAFTTLLTPGFKPAHFTQLEPVDQPLRFAPVLPVIPPASPSPSALFIDKEGRYHCWMTNVYTQPMVQDVCASQKTAASGSSSPANTVKTYYFIPITTEIH